VITKFYELFDNTANDSATISIAEVNRG